ncbi:MAG TPA: MerR family transcriptional regulator [Gammaproteobacteria bacterium]|nr:MerR family transcriptional regulator [Gammaproteobacteria bacterium]
MTTNNNNTQLPSIPDKLYFSIGEVAKFCEVKPHVLRYWEQEFEQLKPSKRRGNRRYYQRKDVLLVWQIKELLYGQGFTIEGARAQLLLSVEDISSLPLEILQRALTDLEDLLLELEAN